MAADIPGNNPGNSSFAEIQIQSLPAVSFDTVKAERADLSDCVTEVHTSEETGDRYTNSHNDLPWLSKRKPSFLVVMYMLWLIKP